MSEYIFKNASRSFLLFITSKQKVDFAVTSEVYYLTNQIMLLSGY